MSDLNKELADVERMWKDGGIDKDQYEMMKNVLLENMELERQANAAATPPPVQQTAAPPPPPVTPPPPPVQQTAAPPPSIKKPASFNVITIGHIDHGKTTLSAAISMYCAGKYGDKVMGYDVIDNAPEENARGITFNLRRFEYHSDKRHYTHIDCPKHTDYINIMSAGAVQIDGAILVVSAPDSVMPQAIEHVIHARKAGVSRLIVFFNKMDLLDDPNLIDLVEEEVRDVLMTNGFTDKKIPIIKGAAYYAMAEPGNPKATKCINELLSAMDAYF